MPNVPEAKRKRVDGLISELADRISGAGHLHYVLKQLAIKAHVHEDGYERLAQTIGVLEDVKLEIQQEKAALLPITPLEGK